MYFQELNAPTKYWRMRPVTQQRLGLLDIVNLPGPHQCLPGLGHEEQIVCIIISAWWHITTKRLVSSPTIHIMINLAYRKVPKVTVPRNRTPQK